MPLNSKHQYPGQAHQAYKVQVIGDTDWREFNTCRLEISVGALYHEGDKFKSSVQWAIGRFDRVVFHVVDTLQRHNIAFEQGLSIGEAYRQAKSKGDQWLHRNIEAINLVSNRPEIYRWDDWKNHPDFAENRKQLMVLYQTNAKFMQAIHDKMNGFWERKRELLPDIYTNDRKEEFEKNTLNYCLEELAGASCFYREVEGITAYPGSFESVWDLVASEEVEGLPEGFKNAQWTRIKFNRNKNYKQALMSLKA
ncbi:tRNA-dependent cyclodipeptide synthase [Roseivirga pacifica]